MMVKGKGPMMVEMDGSEGKGAGEWLKQNGLVWVTGWGVC